MLPTEVEERGKRQADAANELIFHLFSVQESKAEESGWMGGWVVLR